MSDQHCHTLSGHLIDTDAQFVSHEADNAEDDESGEDTGRTVADSYEYAVAKEVVVETVVAGQSDQSAPAW